MVNHNLLSKYQFGLLVRRWLEDEAAFDAKIEERKRIRSEQNMKDCQKLLDDIGDLSDELTKSVDATRNYLSHSTAAVRKAALHCLCNLWQANDQVTTSAFISMLNDPDVSVRLNVIDCLRWYRRKTKDKPTARSLAQIVSDVNETCEIRRIAYDALRDVMYLNVARYIPETRIPEDLDWRFIKCCLTQSEFVVSDAEDWPTELVLKACDFRRAKQAFSAFDFPEVIACCTRELAKVPNHPGAGVYYLRGCARGNLGDYHGAIDDFTAAIREYCKEGAYFRDRSTAYMRLGQIELARIDETQANELDGLRAAGGEGDR